MLNLSNYALPDDAYRLKDLMEGVLQSVVSIYESNNMPLPTRRYITMAAQTVDCEQVVVALSNVYLGMPGDQAATPLPCNSVKSAVITIYISREHPAVNQVGQPPSADQMNKAAGIAAVDSWLLMDNLDQFDQWDLAGPGLGVIATLNAVKNEGGYQTVMLQITVAIP